jgi:hypothetical protein
MEQEFNAIHWNDLRGKLKQRFPLLTNADLTWRHSTHEDLLDMIALKLGKTSKELQEIIEKF